MAAGLRKRRGGAAAGAEPWGGERIPSKIIGNPTTEKSSDTFHAVHSTCTNACQSTKRHRTARGHFRIAISALGDHLDVWGTGNACLFQTG